MAKDANFSFYCQLPTFEFTRHCFGVVWNSTFYFLLTFLTLLQCVAFILMNSVESLDFDIPYGPKNDVEHKVIWTVSSVWIVILLISFVGFLRRIEHLHIPLFLFEVTFTLLSIALTGIFLRDIFFPEKPPVTNSKATPIAKNVSHFPNVLFAKLLCNAIFSIFHGYYIYVIYCLWHDTRTEKSTAAFIARQHMIDDVCEEMKWEEEQGQAYAELNLSRTYPMSGIFDSSSLYSDQSVCSAELTINTMYNAYIHDRRFVTFYEDDESCCYY